MANFDKTTLEGLIFLDKKLLTGFNIEDDNFLSAVSLCVKYYHNVDEHIKRFISELSTDFEKKFGKKSASQEHQKTGVFRWEKYFDDEEGNKYFIVEKTGKTYTAKPSTYEEAMKYAGPGFIITKDKCKIIDFLVENQEEAKATYQFIRHRASGQIMKDGKLVNNPECNITKSHHVPLIVVKDEKNLLKETPNLVQVVNLKFRKEETTLQSLVRQEDVSRIFRQVGAFDCAFELTKEKRYVTEEFASYLGV